MSRDRPCIAVLIGAAWPDNDASGPVQSVRSVARLLGHSYRFEFFARSGPPEGPPLIRHGTRQQRDWGGTTYCDVAATGACDLSALIRQQAPNALWLNSVWDREFTLPALIARRFGRLPDTPVLLSTRGEFAQGALALNSFRKKIMRPTLRASGLLRGVTLHVTGENEAEDVRRAFSPAPLANIGNVRALDSLPKFVAAPDNRLRLLYLGRISPVKGLHHALAAISEIATPACLTIHGPVHDRAYWTSCQAQIAGLPDHVDVEVAGSIANADAHRAYAASDLFLNPSASENFGHTIFEALQAGTPVLTGLATPWNDLENDHAGFNIASDDATSIASTIDRFAAMKGGEWREGARGRAEHFVASQSALDEWFAWFKAAAELPSHHRSMQDRA